MQREGDSNPLPLDVEIERLCQVLVNLAADWWARRVTEEEVTRVWISERTGPKARSSMPRTPRRSQQL